MRRANKMNSISSLAQYVKKKYQKYWVSKTIYEDNPCRALSTGDLLKSLGEFGLG